MHGVAATLQPLVGFRRGGIADEGDAPAPSLNEMSRGEIAAHPVIRADRAMNLALVTADWPMMINPSTRPALTNRSSHW
jgi:hypothetical protein